MPLDRNSPRWKQMSPAKRRKTIHRLIQRHHAGRIPDRFAPPEVKHRRAKRHRLNSPAAPGSSMTNRQIIKLGNSLADVKYGGKERTARQEIRGVNMLSQQIPDWFAQYQQTLAQAQQQTAGANQTANRQIQGLQGSDTGLTVSQSGQTQADLAKSAAQTGGQVDPQLARDAQNAAAVRQRLLASSGAALATQGANQRNFLSNESVLGAQALVNALMGQQREKMGLRGKLEDILKEKGAFQADTRNKLIGDQQQLGLAALGLNFDMAKARAQKIQEASQARQDAREQRHERRQERREHRLDVRKQEETERHNREQERLDRRKERRQRRENQQERREERRDRRKPDFLPQSSQNTAHGEIDQAVAWFRRYKGLTPGSAIRQRLLIGGSFKDTKGNTVSFPQVDHLYVNAAEDIVYRGGLSPANVKALHRAGIRTRGYPILSRQSPPTAQDFTGAHGTGGVQAG